MSLASSGEEEVAAATAVVVVAASDIDENANWKVERLCERSEDDENEDVEELNATAT